MKSKRWLNGMRLRQGAILLTVLAIGSTAYAEVFVRAGALYSGDNGTNSVGFTDSSMLNNPVSISASAALFGTGGSSSATSELGILKTAAGSSASRGNIFDGNANRGGARADASWSDVVRITGSGLSGQGTANVRFSVDGTVTNSGHAGVPGCCLLGDATGTFAFRAGNDVVFMFDTEALLSSQPGASFAVTRVNGTNYGGNLNGFWDIAFPFTFGQALPLFAVIIATTHDLAGSNSTVNSYADFGNSIYWGGITSLSLADGSITTEFSAVGATGHDWRVSAVPTPAAVPEPASSALLLAGLSLFVPMMRRFRRAQEAKEKSMGSD